LNKPVDLAALRDRIGPDHPAMAGSLKKRCTAGNAAEADVIYSYNSGREEMIHAAWAGRSDTFRDRKVQNCLQNRGYRRGRKSLAKPCGVSWSG
jgi:hypothetical protein